MIPQKSSLEKALRLKRARQLRGQIAAERLQLLEVADRAGISYHVMRQALYHGSISSERLDKIEAAITELVREREEVVTPTG